MTNKDRRLRALTSPEFMGFGCIFISVFVSLSLLVFTSFVSTFEREIFLLSLFVFRAICARRGGSMQAYMTFYRVFSPSGAKKANENDLLHHLQWWCLMMISTRQVFSLPNKKIVMCLWVLHVRKPIFQF